MAKGVIKYDDEGLPICELCGKSFKRVLNHVRLKHNMFEKEYKKMFGLDLGKGICSKESSELSRIKTLKNYDKVIKKNLTEKGIKTRFVKNSEGRTKEKVSEQTKIRLKKRYTEDQKFIIAMKKSGSVVGKSGLGNKKRWSK